MRETPKKYYKHRMMLAAKRANHRNQLSISRRFRLGSRCKFQLEGRCGPRLDDDLQDVVASVILIPQGNDMGTWRVPPDDSVEH
jgi:hypothetical protein